MLVRNNFLHMFMGFLHYFSPINTTTEADRTYVSTSLDVLASVGKPVVDLQRGDSLQIRQLLSCLTNTHIYAGQTLAADQYIQNIQ